MLPSKGLRVGKKGKLAGGREKIFLLNIPDLAKQKSVALTTECNLRFHFARKETFGQFCMSFGSVFPNTYQHFRQNTLFCEYGTVSDANQPIAFERNWKCWFFNWEGTEFLLLSKVSILFSTFDLVNKQKL